MTTAKAAKAPFPWYGGKQYIADRLVEMLPPHDIYVEVFGGGASLLFNKRPSKLDVYNDLDSGLVNFFRVLRDETRTRELQRLLALTPYAREEWQECRLTWQQAATDVEMARRWFVAISGSFGHHMGSGPGWSFSRTPGHGKAHSFAASVDAISQFTQRMRGIQVEHGDFARIIGLYDSPSTLFYCDPPYVPETRTRNDRYRHEMTAEDHERLLALLKTVRGAVMLSGYRSDLYNAALSDWRRIDVPVFTAAANRVRAKRTECIWLSPNATAHQPMLPFAESEATA